jgi:membrane-bound inhibitor of C-type lysozyme
MNTLKVAKILGLVLVVLVVVFVVATMMTDTRDTTGLVLDESGNLVPPTPREASGETIDYTFVCPGGETFTTSYDLGANALTLTRASDTYVLPQVVSASGARYALEDGSVVFAEKEGSALVEIDGVIVLQNCTVQEPEVTPVPPPAL